VANLDAVRMPDLAAIGEEALTAAHAHAPLVMASPAVDCRAYHQQILALTRAILRPEAEERVDVHIVENLCSGMTAFLPDPNEAITEVGHALATVFETLGWARPDWDTAVSNFSLHHARHPPVEVPPTPLKAMPDTDAVHEVIPIRRRIMPDSESNSSPYTMSEESRARLIIMAAEEQISFSQALDIVTDYYHSSMKSLGLDLHDLHSILALSKECKVRELPVKHLKWSLAFIAYLREHQLEFEAAAAGRAQRQRSRRDAHTRRGLRSDHQWDLSAAGGAVACPKGEGNKAVKRWAQSCIGTNRARTGSLLSLRRAILH
jgi:hypothetical protein